MSDLDFDLSQYDEDYASAPVESRDSENVPDGKYQVTVHKVELARSKTSDTPMLKWQLKIIAPAHIGRMIFRNNMMGSAENIKWLKQDLYACGLALDKLSELPNHLYELLDVALEVTVKTKGEYTNVFLNKRIQTDDTATPSENVDILPF